MRSFGFPTLLAVLTLTLAPAPALADDPPDGEVAVGAAYMGVDAPVGPRLDTAGWFLSLQDNFTDYFGVAFEASGHYRGSGNVHTLLAGPRFNYREHDRVEPFGHVMAGVAFHDAFDETRFAMAAGGGLDVKITDKVAIRAIQADYVPVFASDVRHNVRVQAGVVFRFEW